MTGSTDDTATITAGTNGTLTIATTDTAASGANILISADGTVGLDAAGALAINSSALSRASSSDSHSYGS